jgi:hypothetical protein
MAGDLEAGGKGAAGKKFSRRHFVAGGGVVLAGGALGSYTADTAAAAATKTPDYPQSSA